MVLKLLVSYEGTLFSGFQRQKGPRSVQEELENALGDLLGRRMHTAGAGRTDAGVHALGQVVSAPGVDTYNADVFAPALNARLPADLRVLAASLVEDDFHARKSAVSKTYRYLVWTAPVAHPLYRRFVWHRPRALDLEALRAGANMLRGAHDFQSFQGAGGHLQSTIRELYDVSWTCPQPDLYMVRVTGNGFLYHMVRNMVGAMVEVGQRRRDAAWIGEVLAGRDRRLAPATAPAVGLCLEAVHY